MQPSHSGPSRPQYHVVPHFRRWAVRRLVNERSLGVFRTQDEAINRAKELAVREGAEIVIHSREGNVLGSSRAEA